MIGAIGRDLKNREKIKDDKLELVRKTSNIINRIRYLEEQSLHSSKVDSFSEVRSYPRIPMEEIENMKKKAQSYEHKTSKSLKYVL